MNSPVCLTFPDSLVLSCERKDLGASYRKTEQELQNVYILFSFHCFRGLTLEKKPEQIVELARGRLGVPGIVHMEVLVG